MCDTVFTVKRKIMNMFLASLDSTV